jgi:hypothetical protein
MTQARLDVAGSMNGQSVPVLRLLDRPIYEEVSDYDRVKLALILVESLMSLHNTKWWPLGCLMSKVAYLNEDGKDLADSMDSLHIASDVLGEVGPPEDVDMESTGSSVISAEDIQRLGEERGVRCFPLYCLGVALLQISLWGEAKVSWEDPADVRQRAKRQSYLGQEFRKAVLMLINCDFGVGTDDLSSEFLQQQICRTVITDLEKLSKHKRPK